MATTHGRVQRFFMVPASSGNPAACVCIGPTAANCELLFVQRNLTDPDHLVSFKNSMVDALVTAWVGRHPVTANHDNSGGEITSLHIDI